ncbi:MAG: ATP-grasp domain-containing protein [Acidobacteriota bacterium]
MPRVLLLATTTGYQTRAFGQAADRLGVSLVFATDRCHLIEDPWRDAAIPIRFHDEDAAVDAIVEVARAAPLDGFVAVGDRPTVIAARVAERLGLSGHPPDAAIAARDKEKTRQRLRDAGLAVPWFVSSRIDADPQALLSTLCFPCVLKPVSLSGSRGVMRADDAAQFLTAFTRLLALLRLPDIRAERNHAHDRLLVEGFIPGRELAIEGLLHHGTLHTLAIFDKPDPLDGPFFEETLYVTPSTLGEPDQRRVKAAVALAAAAIGLRHGPVHAECRVNEQGVFVLEVAARPIGGLCARSLKFEQRTAQPGLSQGETACSLEELLLRHTLGESPDGWVREARASGVMMIPIPSRGVFRGVAGVEAARLVDGVEDVTITAKPDQLLVPLPEGASYLGFIFAAGGTSASVVQSLREAHARLRFTVEPELRVLQSAHGAM